MSENNVTLNPLVPNAIYEHFGRVMLAVDMEYMVLVTESSNGDKRTLHMRTPETKLLCLPASDNWVDRMLGIRNSLIRDLTNERNALSAIQNHLDRLGQALLDKANDHDWCEEYDQFAEEWDLPSRMSEYLVTVTTTVRARNRDEAVEAVSDDIGFSEYSEFVIDGPHVFAEEG